MRVSLWRQVGSVRAPLRAAWAAAVLWCLMAATAFAEPTLDEVIENGLIKVVKYVRWGALAVLAGVFLWAWSERAQNKDNHGVVVNANRVMALSAIGFAMVALYRIVLTGIVSWTGADPTVIPAWLWAAG